MKNFALSGVAGYIAPRHLKAIQETGNRLVAAVDPHDSVGILDSYFPDASFFTEFERFDRHLEKLRRSNSDERVHYFSVCSPNHLHDAHIRLALRIGADVICEKPIVLNPWNLDALEELEEEYGQRVYSVLQLRVHPSILAFKQKLDTSRNKTKFDINLTYITSRGKWYKYSWKGNPEKSGGIVTNIGIHFFDLLLWLFGSVERSSLCISEEEKIGGLLELKHADVKWYLSLDGKNLPHDAVQNGGRTFRSITIDGEEVEFSGGFDNLHTKVYKKTLSGDGFAIEETRPSLELVHRIRTEKVTESADALAPLLYNIKR